MIRKHRGKGEGARLVDGPAHQLTRGLNQGQCKDPTPAPLLANWQCRPKARLPGVIGPRTIRSCAAAAMTLVGLIPPHPLLGGPLAVLLQEVKRRPGLARAPSLLSAADVRGCIELGWGSTESVGRRNWPIEDNDGPVCVGAWLRLSPPSSRRCARPALSRSIESTN